MNKVTWEKWEAIGVTSIREAPYREKDYHFLDKEIFFTGGNDEDIAEMLFNTASGVDLLFMHGNMHITLQKPFGKGEFTIRFSREEITPTDKSFVLSEN